MKANACFLTSGRRLNGGRRVFGQCVHFVAVSVLATLLTASVVACGDYGASAAGRSLAQLAHAAVSDDAASATPARAELRAIGPAGLDALLAAHAPVLDDPRCETRPDWPQVRAAIEAVSRQRDAHVSRLFWFTDLNEAKTAGRAASKPILSLRLLGNLDEELSCANSRFFRTTLYANAEVGQFLRDHFILHWQSVRPVPRITVDFGDGRAIERTITGNSAHHVLDSQGRPVDVIPGLYGAKPFIALLERAGAVALQVAALEENVRQAQLASYHQARAVAVAGEWQRDLSNLGVTRLQPVLITPTLTFHLNPAPPASAAMPLAASKSGIETPLVRATVPRPFSVDELAQRTDDGTWARIAALHREDARVDTRARQLIAAKQPSAVEAGQLALLKFVAEAPLVRVMRNLERSIAEDTVRNEYTFHARIHQWFAEGSAPRDVEALNRRVYAELFLTPDTDPWLGLVPADTFSALEGEGLKVSGKH